MYRVERLKTVACFVVLTAVACSSDSSPSTTADAAEAETPESDVASDEGGGDDATDGSAEDAGPEVEVDLREFPADPPASVGGERPAAVNAPSDYDPSREYPVVLLLHGYGASGAAQDLFLGVSALADDLDFIAVVPDGTVDAGGSRFWNGTNACCNFGGVEVDDVAYLRGLIEELDDSYRIDAGRVYALGHSNGGFMSYRLACEASETFVAIASLAGAAFADPGDCVPAEFPVSVLQVHGTLDETIGYDGGTLGGRDGVRYPSAARSASTMGRAAWMRHRRSGLWPRPRPRDKHRRCGIHVT
jgi:polyhydroxybutyrate depolymerase